MKKLFVKLFSLGMAVAVSVTAFSACGFKFDKSKISIGGIGPLTGGAATYGLSVKNGAQLAIDEINANGGVGSAKLQLQFRMEDDVCDGEKSVNAYNSLKDAGMQILMGTVTSGCCEAVAPSAKDDNMFLLTPSGSDPNCIKEDNAFRICLEDPTQGKLAAKYIKENYVKGNTLYKVGILYCLGSDYSKGIKEAFVLEAGNDFVIKEQSFANDNDTDFSAQITALKNENCNLIFLPIYYQAAAKILKQATSINDVTYFGCDGMDGIIKELGSTYANLAEELKLITVFSPSIQTEPTKSFVANYKSKYKNEVPDQFAADAYDAIYAIKLALEEANITDAKISASDLCNKLKDAMTKITLNGTTGKITWSSNGIPVDRANVVTIKNGQYV